MVGVRVVVWLSSSAGLEGALREKGAVRHVEFGGGIARPCA